MISSENKERVSIVMIAASLPPLPAGGAETQALRLGKALVENGNAICFITPGKGAAGKNGELQGMPVFRLNSIFNRLFTLVSSLRKKKTQAAPTRIEFDDATEKTSQINSRVGWPTIIYYHIFYYHSLFFLWPRRKTFDILHAHTMEWSAIVAARLGKALGKPVLIKDSTMNGFASLGRFPNGERLQRKIISQCHFVAMTRVIEANLKQAGIPAGKISRIPNGIDVTRTAVSASGDRDALRVLFVGNLYQQPAKGVDILLKAWVIVSNKVPGAILELIGDGDLNAYRTYAETLGVGNSVFFHGKQSDLSTFYRSAAIFVLPSRREGMSNALMEAMLHGLPCVATDISGNQDLITPDVSGLLVPAARVEPLAASITYLLEHPAEAQRMGTEAQSAIRSQTDIRIIARHYAELYRRLLAGSVGIFDGVQR
ncbi:MAG TPA: glycosyltransferase family 4 protein [Puia sp.]|nr:glycosyltransferase family 4 protein [Puia sp.]